MADKPGQAAGRWAAWKPHLRRALIVLRYAACLPALALVVMVMIGRHDLTPPVLVALVVTIYPYLAVAGALAYLALFALVRRWVFLACGVVIAAQFLILWHGYLLPRWGTEASGAPLKVMVWNVQRFGQYEPGPSQMAQRTQCILEAVARQKPDVVALLETTHQQMLRLAELLGLPPERCLWSDYFGSGNARRSGLAILVLDPDKRLGITGKKVLSLPPQWKYLYAELGIAHQGGSLPLNLLVLHVKPPGITYEGVQRAVRDSGDGGRRGLRKLRWMLADYKQNVDMQGRQAVQALNLIDRFRDPTLVMGDFNSTRDAALHVRLRGRLHDGWEEAGSGMGATRLWGDFLPLRIDYIYSTRQFQVLQAQTVEAACSDHYPVVVTYAVGAPAPR